MYILGLNAYHGDASAAIFKDGELIAAVEEERIRRIKHWAGFPSESVKFCLDACGITISEVDHITISRDPSANIYQKIIHSFKNVIGFKTLKDRLANTKKVTSLKDELAQAMNVRTSDIKAEIHHVEHHRSHMASSFFASPFENAAILSIDGFGDFTSTMTGVGRNSEIEVLEKVIYPHSVGVFYTAFTQYLGFENYGDEYKVMGLSSYGNATLVEKVKDVVIFKEDGLFEINPKYFRHPKEGVQMSWESGAPYIESLYSEYMVEQFGKAREKGEALTQYHKDLAASVQSVTEALIFHILDHLQKSTGLKNLCIAGGVAQNSVANGKILNNTGFEKLYIPPAGHDAGTAIGSALWLYNQLLKHPRIPPMRHAYFGAAFSDDEVEIYLQSENITYQKLDDDALNDKVVSCLLDAGVIGWFQGRAEFGPRALGHRSILCDPTRADAKELINSKIKRREAFRPFAPSILREYVSEFFEQSDEVPFMEKVYRFKAGKTENLSAVVHVDGSGRLQSVDKDMSPCYHQLITSFYEKTGVPLLLNTSFNENEPIVNTPAEACACFERTDMDILVMGHIVVEKNREVG